MCSHLIIRALYQKVDRHEIRIVLISIFNNQNRIIIRCKNSNLITGFQNKFYLLDFCIFYHRICSQSFQFFFILDVSIFIGNHASHCASYDCATTYKHPYKFSWTTNFFSCSSEPLIQPKITHSLTSISVFLPPKSLTILRILISSDFPVMTLFTTAFAISIASICCCS